MFGTSGEDSCFFVGYGDVISIDLDYISNKVTFTSNATGKKVAGEIKAEITAVKLIAELASNNSSIQLINE